MAKGKGKKKGMGMHEMPDGNMMKNSEMGEGMKDNGKGKGKKFHGMDMCQNKVGCRGKGM